MPTSNPDHASAGVQPGDILAGKYRVERVLGRGGMGVVVAAHHLQLDEKVALKFLLPDALGNPEAVGRFLREARAAVKIKSEHVARVIDVGQLENGSPYMVMEYLEGGDLAGWLRQRGALPVEQAVDFVLQASEALAEAHALGIVHRDLKPANLFCILRADGQLSIKVLDFGISKLTLPGLIASDLTITTAVVGSPVYMSPEQLQSSKNVDARADIWSLGVILFELLTGQLPFEAEAITELAIKIATLPTPPVRTLRRDIPAGLEVAIATCLEKDRTRRFPTVGNLAIALREFCSVSARSSVERVLGTLQKAGVSSTGTPPIAQPAAPPPAAVSGPSTQATWGNTGAGKKSRGPAIVAIVAALVGVVGIGVLVFLRKATPRSVASASSATPLIVAAPAPPSASAAVAAPSPVPLAPPPSAQPAPSSAPSTTVPSAAPPPVAARPPTVPWAHPPTNAAPAAAAARKADCDPPYIVNDKGSRIYKKECL